MEHVNVLKLLAVHLAQPLHWGHSLLLVAPSDMGDPERSSLGGHMCPGLMDIAKHILQILQSKCFHAPMDGAWKHLLDFFARSPLLRLYEVGARDSSQLCCYKPSSVKHCLWQSGRMKSNKSYGCNHGSMNPGWCLTLNSSILRPCRSSIYVNKVICDLG